MISKTKSWPFWLLILSTFLIFVYLIQGILLPFVVGILVAYLLDPVVDRLEGFKISRTIATLMVTLLFFAALMIGLIMIIPLVAERIQQLIVAMPGLIEQQQLLWQPRLDAWFMQIDPKITQKITENIETASLTILSHIASFLGGVMQSGVALINLLSLIFITPIVAFYCLRDWDRIVDKLHKLLPRKHNKTIKEQLKLIDDALSGFIRGQTQVCLLLGIFYAVGLSIVGLHGAILIGLLAGIASFIPYVGMLVGAVVGLLAAWFQFGEFQAVLLVGAVFAIGQFLEGNFVTPKLVGDKVGIHPAWLIFGMLVGAQLFGFLGVILAVPVTAILGVLTRFSIQQYQQSKYYLK